MKKTVFLITCEHASNRLPHIFSANFAGAEEVLQSHEGWDPGALDLAEAISVSLKADLFIYDYSRLLIEVNRSLGHPKLFSRYTNGLDEDQKGYLISTYYQPYRYSVEEIIRNSVCEGKGVIHLSIHSFTPNYFGEERAVEIGLLFDPERINEKNFCSEWCNWLVENSVFQIRMNEPYKGIDDGFTTYLRGCFGSDQYVGIELEVSQGIIELKDVHALIVDSLLAISASPHTWWMH